MAVTSVTSRTIFKNSLARRPAWHLVDASEHVLGRLAAQIAVVISGKHKPCWDPSVDCGDYVVVVNSEKIQLSHPSKWLHKRYRWHTGYPGGLKEVSAQRMLERHPTRLLEAAVSGMLPKNRLRQPREKKLRLFEGSAHTHHAQLEDPLNRLQLDALSFPWFRSRPSDADPLADPTYQPGWMLSFENEGDFIVAHGMPLAPLPRAKQARKEWSSTQQIAEFEQALLKLHQSRVDSFDVELTKE